MSSLYEQIAEILKEYDQKTIDGIVASIPARREALAVAKKDFEHLRKDAFAYYPKLFNAVGGKGWLELLRNTDEYVINSIAKVETAKAEARNAKIGSKLKKLGSFEVLDANPLHNSKGFLGLWKVKTDNGEFTVRLEVILAGGYNVQCLHNRVLVKVW